MPKRSRVEKAAELPEQIDWLVLLIVVAFVVLVRVRLLDLPLERDEGEYAYAGQLLLQGVPPYSQAYNMKFPGMYVAYAIILATFGQTIAGIRIGLMIVNAATIVLLYFLARRLFGRAAALIAAASYAIFSLEPTLLALYAHATHFVNLAVVAALLLLARDRRRWEIIAAGVLLAIAIVIKQQAAAFALFALVWRPRKWLDLLTGGASVGVVTAALLAISGVFSRFWLWTIRYATEYVTSAAATSPLEILSATVSAIFYFAPLLWLIAAAGLVIVFIARVDRVFVAGYTLAAIAAIVPGFYFREHYFIVLLPIASMLIGIAVVFTSKRWSFVPAVVFAIAILVSLTRMWGTMFELAPDRITKLLYRRSPFVEAIDTATYIHDRTSPSDRIAILGSEPEIFFYAQRRSATGYIYTYPLMENQKFAHQMQTEMIAEITRARPKYIVRVTNAPSWLRRPESDLTIFNWAQNELQHGWVLEGIADIGPEETNWVWGNDAQTYRPKSADAIAIYRRADAPSSGPSGHLLPQEGEGL